MEVGFGRGLAAVVRVRTGALDVVVDGTKDIGLGEYSLTENI